MIIYNDLYTNRDEVLKEIKNLDPSNATQEIDISYKYQERKCWIIGMNFLHCSFNECVKSWDFDSSLKDTHKEKVPSNQAPAFVKSMNIYIWVVGTSNWLFITGSSFN